MLDITPILDGWDYDPEEITVRLVEGRDGRPKVQMRLDLGLLQMNYDGRPDGKRPNGYESLYQYYQHQLEVHRQEAGGDQGFFLDPDDCEELSQEALQYYYRYLSLFHLEEYAAVERDTARNLHVFDFVKKYAETEEDRESLEHYRPYVIMMNARAGALLALKEKRQPEAVRRVERAIRRVKDHFAGLGKPKAANRCRELIFLKGFLREISRMPLDPVDELRKKMQEAVEREDYETAAVFRDQIQKLTGGRKG
ncbi:MAG: hypothetical protein GC154_09480 [bacterium]|nr:hypothetical protein [bacterium]